MAFSASEGGLGWTLGVVVDEWSSVRDSNTLDIHYPHR
jgi:hypothetical protein